MRKSSLVFTALLALAMGSVWADDTAPTTNTPKGADFSSLDNDKSGTLSRDEVQGNSELVEQFSVIDANKDEVIDEAEFAKMEVNGSHD